VFYLTSNGFTNHVAVWTSRGVYAKMGQLGLFRFDNLKQMEGPGYFGQPSIMLKLQRGNSETRFA
jgi:hypothetical protein